MERLRTNRVGVVIVTIALVLSIASGYLLNAEDVLDCTTDWQYHTDVAGAFYGSNADMHVPYEPRQNLTGYTAYDPEVIPFSDTTVHAISYTIAEAQNGYWLPEQSLLQKTVTIHMQQTKATDNPNSDPTGAKILWQEGAGSTQTKLTSLGWGMGTDTINYPSGGLRMGSYADIGDYYTYFFGANFTPLSELVHADPSVTGKVMGQGIITGLAKFVVLDNSYPQPRYTEYDYLPVAGWSQSFQGFRFTVHDYSDQITFDEFGGTCNIDGASYPYSKVYLMWSKATETSQISIRTNESAYTTYIDPIGGVTPIPVSKQTDRYEMKEVGTDYAKVENEVTVFDTNTYQYYTNQWAYECWYDIYFIDSNYGTGKATLYIKSSFEMIRGYQGIYTDVTFTWEDGSTSTVISGFNTLEDDTGAPRWAIPKYIITWQNDGATSSLKLHIDHPLFVSGYDPRASADDGMMEDEGPSEDGQEEDITPIELDIDYSALNTMGGVYLDNLKNEIARLTGAQPNSLIDRRDVTIFSDSTNLTWYRMGVSKIESHFKVSTQNQQDSDEYLSNATYQVMGNYGIGTSPDGYSNIYPADTPQSHNWLTGTASHQIEVLVPGGATVDFEDVYWTNLNANSQLSMVIPRPASDMDRTMELRFSDGSKTELGIKYTSADGWQITTETFYTTPYYPFYGINHVVTNIGDWPAISLDMDFTNVATPWLTVTPIESFTNYLSYTELTNKAVQPYTDFKVQHAGLTSIHFPATVSWFNHEIIDTVVFLDSGGLYIQDGTFNLNTSFPNDIIVRLDIRSSAHTGDGASIRINGTEVAHWDVARDKDGNIKDNVWLIDGKEYDFAHVHLFYVDQSCDSIIIDGRTFDGGIYIDGKFYEKGHLYAQYGKNADFTDLGASDRNWDVVMEGTWAFATAYSTGENEGEIVTQWAESGWDWDMNYFALVFIGLCIVGLLIARWKFEMTMGDWLTVIAGIMIVYTLIRVI